MAYSDYKFMYGQLGVAPDGSGILAQVAVFRVADSSQPTQPVVVSLGTNASRPALDAAALVVAQRMIDLAEGLAAITSEPDGLEFDAESGAPL